MFDEEVSYGDLFARESARNIGSQQAPVSRFDHCQNGVRGGDKLFPMDRNLDGHNEEDGEYQVTHSWRE
jgi:hypothetical protein